MAGRVKWRNKKREEANMFDMVWYDEASWLFVVVEKQIFWMIF